MSEQVTIDTEQPPAFARFLVQENRMLGGAPADYLAVLGILGVSTGAYYGMHNLVFSEHYEYDAQQALIRDEKGSAADLEATKQNLIELNGTDGLDTSDEISVVNSQIIVKQTEIQTQVDQPVPEGYNPNVDAAVSVGAGVLTFVVAGVAIFKGLGWLQRKYDGSDAEAQPESVEG